MSEGTEIFCGNRIYIIFAFLKADFKVSLMEPILIGLGQFMVTVNQQNVILISIDE